MSGSNTRSMMSDAFYEVGYWKTACKEKTTSKGDVRFRINSYNDFGKSSTHGYLRVSALSEECRQSVSRAM